MEKEREKEKEDICFGSVWTFITLYTCTLVYSTSITLLCFENEYFTKERILDISSSFDRLFFVMTPLYLLFNINSF